MFWATSSARGVARAPTRCRAPHQPTSRSAHARAHTTRVNSAHAHASSRTHTRVAYERPQPGSAHANGRVSSLRFLRTRFFFSSACDTLLFMIRAADSCSQLCSRFRGCQVSTLEKKNTRHTHTHSLTVATSNAQHDRPEEQRREQCGKVYWYNPTANCTQYEPPY